MAIARHAVVNFVRSCGFTGDEIAEIELAVGEALSNAAKHGGEKDGGSFTVRCACDGSSITIEIRDSGRGFQRSDKPPEEKPATTGFGISIMRALMNEITYSESGSLVRLVRRRDAAKRNGNGNSLHE
ncbi:MAG: hypothetical protein NVS1B14_06230 [Vulcanimicrobiaceae bacterium]